MEWLADRFFRSNGTWIDAASGASVRILLDEASAVDALDWEEQCARLAKVRHPLLNPLLDYGDAPAGQRFEAYAELPPLASGRQSNDLRLHVSQFLRGAGISLDGPRGAVATRGLATRGEGSSIRPLGVTLQPRRALSAIQDVLEG
ncbi:MAG: hypothetical protein H0W18_02070, partial [Acidobacteria bacterium]|nr:hypothetical protein [Acidobacteriota bacterium]